MADLNVDTIANSAGSGAPSYPNGWNQIGTSDIVQALIKAFATQTNDIFEVQKYDGTELLQVTNVSGTKIRGTTSNNTPAAGFLGEIVNSGQLGSAVTINTSFDAVGSQLFTTGNWLLITQATYNGSAGNTYFAANISTTSGDTGAVYGVNQGLGQVITATGVGSTITLFTSAFLASPTTYYLNAQTSAGSAGSGGIRGSIIGLRIF